MQAPCLSLPLEVIDREAFTTKRRAAKFVESNCSRCPADAKAICGAQAQGTIDLGFNPEGVFGGKIWGLA